ncbi:CDP-alcohol phosphatidyltransferase family protein [Porticoccaceae bacterium LTM1]|nr:CDP-alcohol phosphatidyltransferase family protein [Porticoccaceae bacterium LTM1]
MDSAKPDLKHERIFSIPNVLSLTRLGLVPVLLWLAWHGRGEAFLMVLVFSLLTDCFDGYLARKLGQVTDLGARLDSWSDILTYGAMALGLMWAWPDLFNSERWFVLLAIVSQLPPLIYCLWRFGSFPSYHTWSAKSTALLLAPAFFWMTLFDNPWPFRLVILMHVWVAFEEVLITYLLPAWRSNIPSVFHLLAERSAARKSNH